MGKQWKTAGKKEQASKKGALFTKLSREIQVAVRLGGAKPSHNPRLKLALESARSHSLPKDTIKQAMAKSAGTHLSESILEILYEGFGPYGTAFLVLCLTDNRTRTVSEIRYLFKKHNGQLGKSGSVMWMFEKTLPAPADTPSASAEDKAEKIYKAKNQITLSREQKEKALALWKDLVNHRDCQSVYTNCSF